jgi:hypothetical protein
MIHRYAKIGLLTVVLGLGVLTSRNWGAEKVQLPADPQERAAMKETIHNTPLLERPNRSGHFYGNTVRWFNERNKK